VIKVIWSMRRPMTPMAECSRPGLIPSTLSLNFRARSRILNLACIYLGARYYDPALYRFLSPDPVIPTDRALYNPQRWNLYAYCLGNPINYVDISGGQARRLIITRTISGPTGTFGHFRFEGKYLTIEGDTLERPWMDNKNDKSCIPKGDYEAILYYWDRKDKNKEMKCSPFFGQ